MYVPDKRVFLERAARGNLVPVWKELLIDQETPVSAYERYRTALKKKHAQTHTYLLESVEGGEHIARYSFIGGMPRAVFQATGRRVTLDTGGRRQVVEDSDPLDVLKHYMNQFKAVRDPSLPRFYGGAVGYVGYEAVSQFERIPVYAEDERGWPDLLFGITDTLLIFDRVRHTVKVVTNAHIEGDPGKAYAEAIRRIDETCEMLRTPIPRYLIDAQSHLEEPSFRSNVSPETFKASVEKAKEYIRSGDIIQAVLSQRFDVEGAFDPLDVYRALRSVNPSPYMFCLEFGDRHIVGSSPEVHVRCDNGIAEVRPIAGTRPRAEDEEQDKQMEKELLADPKERAEHIMLVDLGRNDLGRVCVPGTVHVPELMTVERYSHVMHIVSDCQGRLKDEYDMYDLIRATFPAGTVSGAPKIRAMEIIHELETARRGPYSGAVTYLGFSGNVDSCIAIRTLLLDSKGCSVQAGAGIVADSDPEKEYEETRNKARGCLKALTLSGLYANAREEAAS